MANPVGRPPLHPQMREQVAAPPPPLREPVHAEPHAEPRKRTRQSVSTISDDKFEIPQSEIPPGSSYEWKRYTNMGQEDPFYIAALRRQGWEPVDPRNHPNWLPPDYTGKVIIRSGMILMERPIELTNEARREQEHLARRQVVEAQQRLGMTPKGEATRELPSVAPRVDAQMMRPVPIQAEE